MELKLINFEGLQNKEKSLDEVTQELTKLIASSAIPVNNEKQNNSKFVRQSGNSNVIQDYAYPFKQDKLFCTIF